MSPQANLRVKQLHAESWFSISDPFECLQFVSLNHPVRGEAFVQRRPGSVKHNPLHGAVFWEDR